MRLNGYMAIALAGDLLNYSGLYSSETLTKNGAFHIEFSLSSSWSKKKSPLTNDQIIKK